MIAAHPRNTPEFRAGVKVVLAEGTYQGTRGVFLKLREDVNWADIKELNGTVRSHPISWLQHSKPTGNTSQEQTRFIDLLAAYKSAFREWSWQVRSLHAIRPTPDSTSLQEARTRTGKAHIAYRDSRDLLTDFMLVRLSNTEARCKVI